jgi:hypothetical protein
MKKAARKRRLFYKIVPRGGSSAGSPDSIL